MKKLPIALLTLMCATMLSSCNKEKLTGSEAAKALLAEERLDSEALKNNVDFSNVKASITQEKVVSKQLNKKRVTNQTRPIMEAKSKTGVEAEREGELITWTNFLEYSNGVSYFDSFIEQIENQSEEAAKLIDDVKGKVDANNVWVKGTFYDRLLKVSADEDVVMRQNNDFYQIVSRTTTDQGEDCYELFNTQQGNKHGSRFKKIGDHRYEYSYLSEDGGYGHYFIADKSRGYWVVSSPLSHPQFSVSILKDDMCYEFVVDVENHETGLLKVITPDQKCDIVTITNDTFEIYAGSIANIDSMTTSVSDSQIAPLGDYNYQDNALVLYDKDDDSYATMGTAKIDVHFNNGLTLKEGDTFADGKVKYNRSVVSGNADGMIGTIAVDVEGLTIEAKLKNFEEFVKETGIRFTREYDVIINSIKMAQQDSLAASKSLTWNDVNIISGEKFIEAENIEVEKLTDYVAMFNEVKDNVLLSRNQQGKLDRGTAFPYISQATFNANYTDNIVNINSAMAKIEEFTLFEQGNKYNLQFALAQHNEENEGYFNLFPLDVVNPAYVTYNGEESLTLSVNNISFVLPAPVEGDYELVTYVADEEGIRVSRPQPITFETVEDGEISIHNYTAQVYKNNENLLSLVSKVNKNVVLKIENNKTTYTYEELHQILTTEAFKYGVALNVRMEMLSPENLWVVLEGDEINLTSGTYRVAFINNENEQVYVSTTY